MGVREVGDGRGTEYTRSVSPAKVMGVLDAEAGLGEGILSM